MSKSSNPIPPQLNLVGPKNKFPKTILISPPKHTTIILALEIDDRSVFGPFSGVLFPSRNKKQALQVLTTLKSTLGTRSDIKSTSLFRASLIPPGQSIDTQRKPSINTAHYDVVFLIEVFDKENAIGLRRSDTWNNALQALRPLARSIIALTTTTVKSIGPVDRSRGGVFLFNFFTADNLRQNLGIWEYTAGWFTDQTGLDNSTLLLPNPDQKSPYTVINHCRWDHLYQIVPHLIFKPSFKRFVLANFNANQITPIPILYRLV